MTKRLDRVEEEQHLVRYLLGRLSPGEQVALEDLYFEDDNLHARLVATRDDLFHAYLRGSLSTKEREQFELNCLASQRGRDRLEFIRVLRIAVARVGTAKTRPRRPIARASVRGGLLAAVVVGAVAGLLVIALHRPTAVPDVVSHAAPARPPEPSPLPVGRPSMRHTPTAGSVTPRVEDRSPRLAARQARVRIPENATEPVDILVPSSARSLRLEVEVASRAPGYDVKLETSDGVVAWHAEGLRVSGPGEPLVVVVDASLLGSNSYALSVKGEMQRHMRPQRSSASYHLRILRVPQTPSSSNRW